MLPAAENTMIRASKNYSGNLRHNDQEIIGKPIVI